MAKLNQKEIRERAKEVIAKHPGGIRYSELISVIKDAHPETPRNTIVGSVWNLERVFPSEIVKPSRGLFMLQSDAASANRVQPPKGKFIESDFYASFAQWLKNDLDEATEAVELGGSGLKGKWGTPDVVGTFKPVPSNRVKFDLEIISGEIKISDYSAVEAFGQATAYRLFSHKVYLVLPDTIPQADQSRIEALALLFGIGYVQFALNPEEPNYSVIVRAQKYIPDWFYVNEFADRLHDHNTEAFNKLFQ